MLIMGFTREIPESRRTVNPAWTGRRSPEAGSVKS